MRDAQGDCKVGRVIGERAIGRIVVGKLYERLHVVRVDGGIQPTPHRMRSDDAVYPRDTGVSFPVVRFS